MSAPAQALRQAPAGAAHAPQGIPCTACQAAHSRAHSPLYCAHCHGCKVRALALGPQFWRSMQEGEHTLAYQGELAAVFGEAGAALGHAVVLAEHLRLNALRNHRNDDIPHIATTTNQGRPC